jgi:anti-anti-sigma regulatory factor
MKHKLWVDAENEILIFQIIGDYTTEEARETETLFKREYEKISLRQLLVDLSEAGPMESRGTRKIQNESMCKSDITDTAFVGATATTRIIARVMTKLGSETIPTQFFATTDEAINWLKNQRRRK